MNAIVVSLEDLVSNVALKSCTAKKTTVLKSGTAEKVTSLKNGTVEKVALQVKSTVTADKAKAFFFALRNAGMVLVDGRRYREENMIRFDEAKAIDELCGYDMSGAHGLQLDNARLMANRALSSHVRENNSRAFSRGSAMVDNGYIAGMPDRVGKERAVLEAHLRQAVESMGEAWAAHDLGKCRAIETQMKDLRSRLSMFGE